MKVVCLRRSSLNETTDQSLIECDMFDVVQTIKAGSDHVKEKVRIHLPLLHELRHLLSISEYGSNLQFTKKSLNQHPTLPLKNN